MGGEKALALGERHRMRRDGTNTFERGTRDGNELHLDWQNRFGDNREPALQQQVEYADDGASQGILDGREERVRGAFGDGAEGGVKGGARHGGDGAAEELNGGGFAESARFALKGHAQVL